MSDRKARLAALAARAGRDKKRDMNPDEVDDSGASNSHTAMETDAAGPKTIKFRNYAPQDESLEKMDVETTSGSEPPTKRIRSEHEEEQPQQQQEETSELEKALKEAKADAAQAMQQANGSSAKSAANTTNNSKVMASMTPKKVNWDLKRDIAKKMNRLERRTQKALVELLRQRLEKEAEMEDDEDGNNHNRDDLD